MLLIAEQGEIGETYLIGADGEKNNLSVVRAILKAFGRDENDFEHVNDRPGHDMRYAIDSSKLRTKLGWQPKYTDFAKGLSDTIDWYKNNPDWWQPQKTATEAKYKKAGF